MQKPLRVALFAIALVCALYSAVGTPLLAGAHTWDVNEVFVNGDGSVWFIELKETGGGDTENAVGGHDVFSFDTLQDLMDVSPIIVTGASIQAEIWARDPGNPDTFLLSDGLSFAVCP